MVKKRISIKDRIKASELFQQEQVNDARRIQSYLKTLTPLEFNIIVILHKNGAQTNNGIREHIISHAANALIGEQVDLRFDDWGFGRLPEKVLTSIEKKITNIRDDYKLSNSKKLNKVSALLSNYGVKVPGYSTIDRALENLLASEWIAARKTEGGKGKLLWMVDPNYDFYLQLLWQ